MAKVEICGTDAVYTGIIDAISVRTRERRLQLNSSSTFSINDIAPIIGRTDLGEGGGGEYFLCMKESGWGIRDWLLTEACYPPRVMQFGRR